MNKPTSLTRLGHSCVAKLAIWAPLGPQNDKKFKLLSLPK